MSPWLPTVLIIPALVVFHLHVSPYTKVEESFNIQAVHDLLAYGISTEHAGQHLKLYYDHMTFPGAVPRTFIGALVLAGFSKPSIWMNSGVNRQWLVRLILGLFNASSLVALAIGLRRAFGKPAAIWYAILQASQFHLLYYASRPLPNMFAFGITTFALSSLLVDVSNASSYNKRLRLALYLMMLATVIFRAELALLVASHTIFLLAKAPNSQFRFSLIRSAIIPAGLAGVLIGIPMTVTIDTFLWQSSAPIWPELSAFLSNIFPSKGSLGASAWGTSPWHWYLTSALPRLFLNPLTFFLIVFSLTQPSIRSASLNLLLPNLTYIGLYSFLAHKETRFLFPVVPPLTACAALSASFIFTRRNRTLFYRVASYTLVLSTLVIFLTSHAILLPLSALNYPGALALNILHASVHDNTGRIVNVHLDNLACQTGVTRFLQIPPEPRSVGGSIWTYDKSDNETELLNPLFWGKFDYVIMETPALAIGAWEVVNTVYGLGRPRIIRLGDEEESLLKQTPPSPKRETGVCALVEVLYGPAASLGCYALQDMPGRKWMLGQAQRWTRGWWLHVGLEPKLHVMKRINPGVVLESAATASLTT